MTAKASGRFRKKTQRHVEQQVASWMKQAAANPFFGGKKRKQ
jgi:hypothetical protein